MGNKVILALPVIKPYTLLRESLDSVVSPFKRFFQQNMSPVLDATSMQNGCSQVRTATGSSMSLGGRRGHVYLVVKAFTSFG